MARLKIKALEILRRKRHFFRDSSDSSGYSSSSYEDCTGYCYMNDAHSDDEDDEEEDDSNLQEIEPVEEPGEYLLKLPFDVFIDIFSRLSVGSLAQCRRVCKTWCRIVHHPRFIKMHNTRTIQFHHNLSLIIQPQLLNNFCMLQLHQDHHNVKIFRPRLCAFLHSNVKFKVVGSCNGLVCLFEKIYGHIYVCNPVIGEYFVLPKLSTRQDRFIEIQYGFGCDQVGANYKVIRLLFDSYQYAEAKFEAEVYSLCSGTWRNVGEVPCRLCCHVLPVLVSGALHWIMDDEMCCNYPGQVIAFDVSKEIFYPISPPSGVNLSIETHRYRLRDFKSCLCLCYMSPDNCFEIWIMKDYWVEDSWTKEYTFSRQDVGRNDLYIHPVLMLNNGEILLESNHNSLIFYDPKRRRVRKLETWELPPSFSVISHVESFISLRNVIGHETRSVGSKRRWYRTLNSIQSQTPVA